MASSDFETEPPAGAGSPWERWSNGLLVLLLTASSVLAAWSGYQASLWGGELATAYNQASARRVESVRASLTGYQLRQVDIALFLDWLSAFQQDDRELTEFIEARFSPRLAPAFAAWMATAPRTNPAAPPDPFAMPEYQVPEFQTAFALDAEAEALFIRGQDANQLSGRYVAMTVLLALVLFCAGLCLRVAWRPAHLTLIGLSVALFVLGCWLVSTLPLAAGLPLSGYGG